MKKITSDQNPRLKNAVRLKTSRGRKTQRRIIIFGEREVDRAVASGIQLQEVFYRESPSIVSGMERLRRETGSLTEFYELPPTLMDKLKYGEREVDVVAIAQRPDFSLANLSPRPASLFVILESIEKPGNIGAVLRSMDGSGATGLILADPKCDVLHPNCIRASLGSAFTVPLAIASTTEAIDWCRENRLEIYAARDSATTVYSDVDWNPGGVIVLGNEATGLTDAWIADGIKGISIPMTGISDSLNISVAAGVILYEANRQRGTTSPGSGAA